MTLSLSFMILNLPYSVFEILRRFRSIDYFMNKE
jgi:hypothetical protein